MATARDHLSKADAVMIATIEVGVPILAEARDLIGRFHAMIRRRIVAELDPWITDGIVTLLEIDGNPLGNLRS